MDIQVILGVIFTLLSTHAERCLEKQQCSNCSSTTNHCITDCFPGYFDLKCKSPCSKNCKNSECSLTSTGISKCSDGCIPGFRGSQCRDACANPTGNCTKCPQGCDGTFCHLVSSCVSGCHDSYYGSNCKTCSGRCRHCNRTTGRCDVCRDPYSGGDCQFSCEHCSTTDCVQTCAPGLYGRTCSKVCSENCVSHPATNTKNTVTSNSSASCVSECHRSSGECINGCVDGWSGQNCSSQIQCNSNCMGCNETGACVDGCLPGYHGNDCKPCSETCFNHTCHPNNGTCDNGCMQGQYGQFCKLSCTNCPGDVCHLTTGICAKGSSDNNEATIGTSTALVFFVFGIIVTVCIFHCKRVSANRNHQGDDTIHTERSRQVGPSEAYALHQYWDIDDYDEVSQPPDQQQGPVEEDSDSDPALPVLADYFPGALDTEINSGDPALFGLADYFPGALDTEDKSGDPAFPVLADYFSEAVATEDNISEPVIPLLADYFPGALDTENKSGNPALVLDQCVPGSLVSEDKSSENSCRSSGSSQSYTHLMRDVFADNPRTVVTYLSPTEDIT